MEKEQKIKCDVKSCRYNDQKDEMCDLTEIKVGCEPAGNNAESANETSDTVCKSFKKE